MKKIWKILSNLPILIVVFFAFFILSAKYPIFGGYRFFTVVSGSMEPKIKRGSLILNKQNEDYKTGDVITFKIVGTKNTVTHRIVEVKGEGKDVNYKVKGDANDASDNDLVWKNNVIGRVVFAIPLVGYPIAFSKTLPGLIILVVIPATIIVYSELINIKNEALRLIAERKRGKLTTKEKVEEKLGEEILAFEGAEKGIARVIKNRLGIKK